MFVKAPFVLLVEDEPSIADALIYVLQSEAFRVQHVGTGQAALDAMAEVPDLVILDIGLPDMSGFDVCRQIRSDSEVPVLFLTARDAEIDQVLGLELGADDYVTKPFSPRAIVARVRAILRRAGAKAETAPAPVDANAPFQHDTSAMTISIAGSALDLTAHEYKLLLHFSENPGRVFSREQLLMSVWPDPYAVTDRTVDAHVKTLRAKLKSAGQGCEDWIQTRRGLGYAFQANVSA